MTDAIFLSASVPDPKRAAHYAKTADTVAITAAVSALIYVTLGRRLLVWGGHPAITPMIWEVAHSLNTGYGAWVKLYQSKHFKDEYPEDNQRFQNVTYTEEVNGDREESLRLMRERMFTDFTFQSAVFIGGMGGIIDEFELLHKLQPKATLLPVMSTGGAVQEIAEKVPQLPSDLRDDLDYISVFHRLLDISAKERRYRRPSDQPSTIPERLWKPSKR